MGEESVKQDRLSKIKINGKKIIACKRVGEGWVKFTIFDSLKRREGVNSSCHDYQLYSYNLYEGSIMLFLNDCH